MIPLMDLKLEYEAFGQELNEAAIRVLSSGRYILGPEVEAFEKEVASYIGVKRAVGVANGTDALELVLEALGIGEGDEVITTPFTFFATAEVVARRGAKPVFVDVEPDTMNIDPAKIEEKITEKTKVIIPVHIFGHPADMDPIMEVAEEHGLFVLEDSAQAFGTEYKGRKAGSIGHASIFSFFPTKNLGGFGDGGMVTTDDEKLAEKISILRRHGATKHKYFHEYIGRNSRLDELQAALLRVKLAHIDELIERRRRLARRYLEALSDVDGIRLPVEKEYALHTYHLFVIRVEESHRDRLAEFLRERGIATGVYYPIPLHLQEAFSYLGYREGDLPQAERACREALAIPLYTMMGENEQKEVVRAIREYFGKR